MRNALATIFVASLLTAPSGWAEVRVERLEAAFVQKFTHYIEWPARGSDQFTIGVMGGGESLAALREAFEGKSVGPRAVTVKAVSRLEKGEQYDIIHVGDASPAMKELKNLSPEGLLVISRTSGGMPDGSIINFYVADQGKLRFQIDGESAAKRGLKINSRLLNLAKEAR